MTLISMDTEGYSGRQIWSVSNCSKDVLFLVPLQEVMDTQPFPYNSAEFAKMPKVPCVTCNTTMPLQMLALHTEECNQNSNVSCVCICLNCEFCIATLAQQQNTFIYMSHTQFVFVFFQLLSLIHTDCMCTCHKERFTTRTITITNVTKVNIILKSQEKTDLVTVEDDN